MTKQLTYKIAKLWGKAPGATEKYTIDEKISFPEDRDLNFSTNFTGKLTLIRLKDEISALLNDAQIDVRFTCNKCLKDFHDTVEIREAEREFFYEEPTISSQDLDELFFIDRGRMTIDLNEMVRQEIILHFPLIPVCSLLCKGLCQMCGKDQNRVKCKCRLVEVQDENTHKPFKNLKKLIK